MDGYQKVKRQLLPLIKGVHFIVAFFVIGLFIAKTIVKYTPNQYQTIAKIKLDDQKFGLSNNEMYKDFEVFSVEHKIDAEAELLKSPLIINQALDSLGFDAVFSRIGSLRKIELYDNSPFRLKKIIFDPKHENQTLLIHVISDNDFTISYEKNEVYSKGKFGQLTEIKGGQIILTKNQQKINKLKLNYKDLFELKLFSRDALINDISSKLDVTAHDKETPILRVVYKDKHPQKVADFVNQLCKTYIDDYVFTKSEAARQTVSFIEEELDEISRELGGSENTLESFKHTNDVVNTLQETETGLREISKLKIELINLEINEKAMYELQSYISKGEYFDETAINIGFGDLLMTELVKKLKQLYDEKHDLSVKYTANSEQMMVVNKKIKEIKVYIKEAINRNLHEIQIKRADYEKVVEEATHMFDYLPTREKDQHILERNFRINEDVYNFLMQKKMDAAILASSMISFHRIIQPATVPDEPVSPNKTLLTFVFGLFGLIIGISFVYFRQFTRARVMTRFDIEKNSTIPFLGVIRKGNKGEDFIRIYKALRLKTDKEKMVVSINSSLSDEGKTYITKHLAKICLQSNISVCIIQLHNDDVILNVAKKQKIIDKIPVFDVMNITKTFVDELKTNYDVILIDTPATANEIGGIYAMQLADLTLFIIRANHTNLNYLNEPEIIKEEYQIDNMFFVLNNAHKASNYTGNYIGSRFHFKTKLSQPGLWNKIKRLYQTYLT